MLFFKDFSRGSIIFLASRQPPRSAACLLIQALLARLTYQASIIRTHGGQCLNWRVPITSARSVLTSWKGARSTRQKLNHSIKWQLLTPHLEKDFLGKKILSDDQ